MQTWHLAVYVRDALWDAVRADALEALLPHAPGGEREPGEALPQSPACRVQEAAPRYGWATAGLFPPVRFSPRGFIPFVF